MIHLAGIETEYGIAVDGVGPEGLVDRARDFVRSWTTDCFRGWDYSVESPRSDLRGFKVDHLAIDPVDAQFERSSPTRQTDADVRSDRVLVNGARFYNDHGHPEYSTPECFSLEELALHDQAGELFLARMARREGVRLYKNNTDYHGASYGTHESYLVPRAIPFEALYAALLPLFVVRPLLVGAGTVGSDGFQCSQRADFFMEPCNVETLYRRPIFNTRDEPHADPREWQRLHVICGDANMMPSCTRRKVGLVRLVLDLVEQSLAPTWKLRDPVAQAKKISRSRDVDMSLELESGSWTTPAEIFESYLCAAQLESPSSGEGDLHCEAEKRGRGGDVEETPPPVQRSAERPPPRGRGITLADECRDLIAALRTSPEDATLSIDWVAKHLMLDSFRSEEDLSWNDPAMQALDLQYHAIDPDESLYAAFAEGNALSTDAHELEQRLTQIMEPTRARVRSVAVRKFAPQIEKMSWSSIRFKGHDELYLAPDLIVPDSIEEISSVESLIQVVKTL